MNVYHVCTQLTVFVGELNSSRGLEARTRKTFDRERERVNSIRYYIHYNRSSANEFRINLLRVLLSRFEMDALFSPPKQLTFDGWNFICYLGIFAHCSSCCTVSPHIRDRYLLNLKRIEISLILSCGHRVFYAAEDRPELFCSLCRCHSKKLTHSLTSQS